MTAAERIQARLAVEAARDKVLHARTKVGRARARYRRLRAATARVYRAARARLVLAGEPTGSERGSV